MMIKKSVLALTMGAALFAGALQAQTPSPMSGEGHQMRMQGKENAEGHADRFAKRHQHRMDTLKQSLKLSQEQAPAWAAFEGAMQAEGLNHPEHNTVSKMTTPERLDIMTTMKAQHNEQMQKRLDATRTFYATLTPEQKKTFDQGTAQLMQKHDRRGEHGGQHRH